MPRQPGRVGPYRIERRLGAGGMGVVYLGHDDAGTAAAVKLIRPEHVADAQFRTRLRREVEAARRVPRFCTAPVLGADLDAEVPWVATEYVEGPSLDVALVEHGRLQGAELDSFAVGVAVALREIHAHGVVHRDLKPSNILLSPVGPRVIDFGIARTEGAETQLTQTGAVVGTPAYMAPEQLRSEPLTAAVDVFAWAALVVQAATGRPPFGAGTGAMSAILHDEPDLGDLPEPLRGLVTASLAKDPARRPSAAELVDRLSHGAAAATTHVLAAAAVPGGPGQPAGPAAGPDVHTAPTLAPGGATPATQGTAPPQAAVPPPAPPPRPGRRRWLIPAAGGAALALVVASVLVVLPQVTGRPGADGEAAPPGGTPASPEATESPGESPAGAGALEGERLTIAVLDGWEEGVAASYLWGHVLTEEGAEVDYITADPTPTFQAVAAGDADISFDAWLPATHEGLWAEYGDAVEDLGFWFDEAPLTVAVNEDSPARSLADLNEYADDYGNEIVGIELGSGLTRIVEEDVIPTYGLDDMPLVPSSTDEMLTELEQAIDAGEDIAVTLWEPHWAYAEYPIRNLADPEGTLGDAEQIHAFARTGFSDDFPEVAGWVGNFHLTRDQLYELERIVFIEDGAAAEDEYLASVQTWLDDNPDWIDRLKAGDLRRS